VAPGPYWTPLQLGGGQPMDKLVKFGDATPLGRPGQPAEIAAQYVLLASQESIFTTGNVWGSTGGETGP
jgi:NAD(P)-dependent dehydrogenase (short-subunit alcohol dehydrogenase family)